MEKILQGLANLISSEDKRMTIGISGHGASGKTTFTFNLLELLGHDEVNYINTDPYIIGSNLRKYTLINYEYKNEYHHEKMTACHPDAHNILALERDIHMMRDGLDFYTIGTNYTKSTLISLQNKINKKEAGEWYVESVNDKYIQLVKMALNVYTGKVSSTGFNNNSLRKFIKEKENKITEKIG